MKLVLKRFCQSISNRIIKCFLAFVVLKHKSFELIVTQESFLIKNSSRIVTRNNKPVIF